MNVLYLDNEPSNRMVMDDMLAVVSLLATHALSVADALEAIAGSTFDLHLIDLRAAGLQGVKAISRQLASDERSNIRTGWLVVVTSDRTLLTRVRCLQAGADDVIIKPVAMSSLMAVITAAKR